MKLDSQALVIPEALYRDRRISPGAQRDVLAYLAMRQGRNANAWPAVATIAGDLGYTRRGVQKALAFLRAEGFIAVVEAAGHSNRYTVDVSAWGSELSAHLDADVRTECAGGGELSSQGVRTEYAGGCELSAPRTLSVEPSQGTPSKEHTHTGSPSPDDEVACVGDLSFQDPDDESGRRLDASSWVWRQWRLYGERNAVPTKPGRGERKALGEAVGLIADLAQQHGPLTPRTFHHVTRSWLSQYQEQHRTDGLPWKIQFAKARWPQLLRGYRPPDANPSATVLRELEPSFERPDVIRGRQEAPELFSEADFFLYQARRAADCRDLEATRAAAEKARQLLDDACLEATRRRHEPTGPELDALVAKLVGRPPGGS
ncbi:MAG: hypothetical protein H6721_12380 [Sandaracinus sp.]|nr:hypothetical protein [Sandaracinus sp.]